MDKSEIKAPAILRELTPGAFNQWRHEPITKLFLGYMLDKAEDLQDLLLAEALSDADLPDGRRGYLRGMIWVMRELHELPLAGIQELYGIEAKPQEKAPE